MRILFDHGLPFMLAHGGLQIQIEQTKTALEEIGVEVEYLRWWDATQAGDIIHFFGRARPDYIEFAHAKEIRVVISELLGGLSARPAMARLMQRALIATSRRILPETFTLRLAWDAYKVADAVIALTPYEAHLMVEMFEAAPDRIHVVPNGVEDIFFGAPNSERGKWLVCTATITPRKRVLELALAAVEAKTPLWVIGKAYGEADSYVKRFNDLCAQNSQVLRYEGAIENRERLAQVYREAKGFVLLSSMESLSLSALEASASGCPLLLSDLPWAKSTFGNNAKYCPITTQIDVTANVLREFYDASHREPPKPKTWGNIASQLKGIYQGVCRTSL